MYRVTPTVAISGDEIVVSGTEDDGGLEVIIAFDIGQIDDCIVPQFRTAKKVCLFKLLDTPSYCEDERFSVTYKGEAWSSPIFITAAK